MYTQAYSASSYYTHSHTPCPHYPTLTYIDPHMFMRTRAHTMFQYTQPYSMYTHSLTQAHHVHAATRTMNSTHSYTHHVQTQPEPHSQTTQQKVKKSKDTEANTNIKMLCFFIIWCGVVERVVVVVVVVAEAVVVLLVLRMIVLVVVVGV